MQPAIYTNNVFSNFYAWAQAMTGWWCNLSYLLRFIYMRQRNICLWLTMPTLPLTLKKRHV